jgi:hypothetical protein
LAISFVLTVTILTTLVYKRRLCRPLTTRAASVQHLQL